MELSDRKRKILKSIIDAYIQSGEPVGSKYLITTEDLNVSSATVRNEMNELEQLGFLEQPHTSAGRVPTALGYRTYINTLMEKYLLSIEELNLLNELTSYKVKEVNTMLEQASRAISRMTNYTSFAVVKPTTETAARFETVYIDDYTFIIIVLCDQNNIKNKTFKSSAYIGHNGIKIIQEALNTSFTKIEAENITMPIFMRFEEALGEFSHLASRIMRTVYEILSENERETLHVEGLTKLLSHPEFNSVSKAKGIIEMIESKKNFFELLDTSGENNLNVFFGNGNLPVEDTSFVYRPINIKGKTVGVIGVIGPKRMNYKKIFASLDYLAAELTDELNENKGDNKDE